MQDEVDRLVAAWARERPDLDVAPARGAQPRDPAGPAPRPGPEQRVRGARARGVGVRRAGGAAPGRASVRALPRPAARPDPGDLRHDDQPGRPAGDRVASCSGCPTRPTAVASTSGSPAAARTRVDAALADLLARERDLLATLSAKERETLSALLRRLVAPFEPRADYATSRPGRRPGSAAASRARAAAPRPPVRRPAAPTAARRRRPAAPGRHRQRGPAQRVERHRQHREPQLVAGLQQRRRPGQGGQHQRVGTGEQRRQLARRSDAIVALARATSSGRSRRHASIAVPRTVAEQLGPVEQEALRRTGLRVEDPGGRRHRRLPAVDPRAHGPPTRRRRAPGRRRARRRGDTHVRRPPAAVRRPAGAPARPASKPGSSSRIASTSPATSRASGPTVSSDGESGKTPAVGTRPRVVFSPAMPQHAAGMRTDPPVSVPSATSASPSATDDRGPAGRAAGDPRRVQRVDRRAGRAR